MSVHKLLKFKDLNFNRSKKNQIFFSYMDSNKFLLLGMLHYFLKNDKFSYLIEDYHYYYADNI
jgi:hypothetical protein